MRNLLSNAALVYGGLAWGIAQVVKVVICYVRDGKLDLSLLLSTGGMPSSHSALVSAIAMAIAMSEGLGSPLFALAVAVAAVVMYDATSVRRATGHHATILNLIIDELFQGHPISDEKLRELLGHTPTQVVLGALLGVFCTWIGMRFVWSGP